MTKVTLYGLTTCPHCKRSYICHLRGSRGGQRSPRYSDFLFI